MVLLKLTYFSEGKNRFYPEILFKDQDFFFWRVVLVSFQNDSSAFD